jgi:hypothetical protein
MMANKKDAAQEGRDKLLTKAYGKATASLRDAHRDEFNRLYAQSAQALGVKWEPRLTDEQKAERDLDALLERFPHLRQKFDPDPEPDPEP